MINPHRLVLNDNTDKYAFSIERYENQILNCQSPTRLFHNRILFVEKGYGTISIDDYVFSIGDNRIFLMAQDQIVQWEMDLMMTGYELNFDEFFWEKAPASASNCKSVLFDNAAVNQLLQLNHSDFGEIQPTFSALWMEHLKKDYINKADVLAAYLKIMMIKIANVNATLKEGFDSYEYQQYRKFYNQISNDFMVSHEVDYYAAELNISARKLTAICKRYSGKGAKELINRQLMAEAKRHLQFSTNPVKDIAYYLRFATPEQFSHFFKKNASQSPSHYRSYLVKTDM